MTELLANSPTFFCVVVGLFGLLIGSFLNVVIHRLPLMMEREWKSECMAFLETANDANEDESETFNLLKPRSRCPACAHEISALENIPVLSYLVQGGKCKGCAKKISLRYPLVELLSALVAVLIASFFGFSMACLFALALAFSLIALAAIDFDTQLLPDSITFPMLWLGLIANYFELFVPLEEAVLGAIFGYLALWCVFWGFKLATGKDGMGYGDFKLLALLGAWLGWQQLPTVIILSSVVGAVIGISLMLFRSHERSTPIPFGPYLAIAGLIALLYGDAISGQYLGGSAGL